MPLKLGYCATIEMILNGNYKCDWKIIGFLNN